MIGLLWTIYRQPIAWKEQRRASGSKTGTGEQGNRNAEMGERERGKHKMVVGVSPIMVVVSGKRYNRCTFVFVRVFVILGATRGVASRVVVDMVRQGYLQLRGQRNVRLQKFNAIRLGKKAYTLTGVGIEKKAAVGGGLTSGVVDRPSG